MLRNFGCSNVKVLNGGMRKWLAEGRKVFSGATKSHCIALDDPGFNFEYLNPSKNIMDINVIYDHAK